jgi:hypothetical protein
MWSMPWHVHVTNLTMSVVQNVLFLMHYGVSYYFESLLLDFLLNIKGTPPFPDPKFSVFSKLIFSFLWTDWSVLYLSTTISWLFVENSSSCNSIREGTCTGLLGICLIENLISVQKWKIRQIYGLSTISHRSAMSKKFFDICSTCVRVRSR